MEDELPFDLMEGILCRLPALAMACFAYPLAIEILLCCGTCLPRSTRFYLRFLRNSVQNWFAFGYDPCNDDYKLVRFYHWESRAISYSLKLNSWGSKHGSCNIFRDCVLGNIEGVYVDGALNWRGRDKKEGDIIISLDFNTVKARTLRLPYYEPNDGFGVTSLNILEGNLCVGFTRYWRRHKGRNWNNTEIWVMKEYGNEESWTKLFSMRGAEMCPPPYKPLTYIHGDQVLLLSTGADDANLIYYNLKKKKFSFGVCIPERVYVLECALICHESHVPINQDSAVKSI
ncbi:hypothetical protein COLO4_31681 [Corchorus olitorius]|uniref:F-box associated beta-propeller type 1 domain-containing protein n=1 Tax=Corchorus olitorius TaxID=93759 RepID=A0A1R3H3X5_9ROSI|nr:hypothetical protein COLO4_31681 [Corchorus olitorius]